MIIRDRRIAVAVAVWSLSASLTGAVLELREPHDAVSFWVLTALGLPSLAVVLALLVRLPQHALTKALAVSVVVSGLSAGPGRLAGLAGYDGLHAALDDLGWLGGLPMLPLLFVLYPAGWPRGRWRRLAQAEVAALIVLAVVTVLRHGRDLGPVTQVVSGVCAAVLLLGAFAGGARLAVRGVRARRSRPEDTPFAAIAVLAVLAWFLLPTIDALVPLPAGLAEALVFGFLLYGPPLALGYAVLRHQLWDLDLVVRRFAVAAAAGMLLLTAYLLIVLALGPAAAVLALVLAPAHSWLQRLVERRLYGDRRDPRLLLEHLADGLAAVAPEDVAGVVATRTAEALRLPWVAVELDREGHWEVVGEDGTKHAVAVVHLDVTHAGEVIGRLVVQARRGQPALSSRDLRALQKVAVQAAPALSAARLVDELTQSRERLVTGREDERARLRRELHDGLSPSLAGMSLALNAARQRLGEVPADVDRLLGTVQEEAVQASLSVRTLLTGLQPPGLEELGLVGALEDRARHLTRPLDFEVTVLAGSLPPLSSAVEVAAYRIALEAMTNAARHSGGHHCDVELLLDGRLHLSVRDDGHGFDGTPPGVGLGSMNERALELGGELLVDDTSAGTLVRALLPT